MKKVSAKVVMYWKAEGLSKQQKTRLGYTGRRIFEQFINERLPDFNATNVVLTNKAKTRTNVVPNRSPKDIRRIYRYQEISFKRLY